MSALTARVLPAIFTLAMTTSLVAGCGGDGDSVDAATGNDDTVVADGPGGEGAATATDAPSEATPDAGTYEPVDVCALADRIDWSALFSGNREFTDDPTDRGASLGTCQVRYEGVNVLLAVAPASDYELRKASHVGEPFTPSLGDESAGYVFTNADRPEEGNVTVVARSGDHTISVGTPNVTPDPASQERVVRIAELLLDQVDAP